MAGVSAVPTNSARKRLPSSPRAAKAATSSSAAAKRNGVMKAPCRAGRCDGFPEPIRTGRAWVLLLAGRDVKPQRVGRQLRLRAAQLAQQAAGVRFFLEGSAGGEGSAKLLAGQIELASPRVGDCQV